jgi:endonuclease/exonuclease/phosphatase family metal-dependent hydrolase
LNKIFYSISLLIVLLAAVALLASMGTAYSSPDKLHIFAFVGFAFPALWIINLFLVFWLIFRRSWLILIPAIALAITYSHWTDVFQLRSNKVENITSLQQPLTVMSYNTRMFDFYDHSNLPETPQKTFEFILGQSPDIICFQEYFTSLKREDYTPHAIATKFRAYKHKQIEYLQTHKGNTGYGLAIFSKHPIIDGGAIRFERSRNLAIYSDIDVQGTVIRVFNAHLESIGFQDDDLNVLDSLDFIMSESQKQGLINISTKLTRAFNMRSSQAEALALHISNSPYLVIVCGDFNDTPISYVYRTMRGPLKDAFRESGFGFGGTYSGRLPSFRIDYIFHAREFNSYNFENFPIKYSDHYPIMTTIDLQPKQ